jgi:hypothetical protein
MTMLPVFAGLMAVFLATAYPQNATPRKPASQPIYNTAPALADFQKRVQEYALLHLRVAKEIGSFDPTKSPKEISARQAALADAMRAARPGAKPGDLFSPEPARLFKVIIHNEFAERSKTAIRNRQDSQDELPDFAPKVNQVYPTAHPLATFPPGLLRQLPELPKPLEYRLVQMNLILRDSEANLIVDVLPAAAPALK